MSPARMLMRLPTNLLRRQRSAASNMWQQPVTATVRVVAVYHHHGFVAVRCRHMAHARPAWQQQATAAHIYVLARQRRIYVGSCRLTRDRGSFRAARYSAAPGSWRSGSS